MMLTRRAATLGGVAASAGSLAVRRAHAAPPLKIGCLTDMSGPYKDLAGRLLFLTDVHSLGLDVAQGIVPTDDDCFGAGTIRADGRMIHPSYLWEVKQPSESKGPWDYYKPIASTPADKAFRPLDKGGCPLVKS